MNVLRAPDFLRPPVPESEFKGLKRIMVMFIAAVVVCAGICAVTIIRDAALHSRHAQNAEMHIPCTCMGRCLRH